MSNLQSREESTQESIDKVNQTLEQAFGGATPHADNEEKENIPHIDVVDRTEYAKEHTDRSEFSQESNDDLINTDISPKVKRNRIPAKDRINKLTKENNGLRAAYDLALKEAEKARRERDRAIAAERQKHEIAVANEEHALKTDVEFSKKLLKEAADNYDSDKMVEAQQLLARRTAQMENLKLKKQLYPSIDPEEFEEETPVYYPSQQDPYYDPQVEDQEIDEIDETEDLIREATYNVVENNPWMNKQHPKYNPKLAKEFEDFGYSLEDKFQKQGRNDILQDPAQFFSIALNEFKNRRTAKSPFNAHPDAQSYQVAPVSRDGGGYTSPRSNNPSTNALSPQEYEIAINTPDKYIPGIEKCSSQKERDNLKAYYYLKEQRELNSN